MSNLVYTTHFWNNLHQARSVIVFSKEPVKKMKILMVCLSFFEAD